MESKNLNLAGEFAVATELCRRDIYAQLTLGNQKSVDLLAMSCERVLLPIEVKSKQIDEWANQRGIPPGAGFLIFVDFAGKKETDRPYFFVLSADDWRALAAKIIEDEKKKHPEHETPYLDENNCP